MVHLFLKSKRKYSQNFTVLTGFDDFEVQKCFDSETYTGASIKTHIYFLTICKHKFRIAN